MRANEFLTEGRSHPVICVDVQPAYDRAYQSDRGPAPIMLDIMKFVQGQTGQVLMFVNAEETGTTEDDIQDIQRYWEDSLCGYERPEDRYEEDEETGDYEEKECDVEMNWGNVTIVDKGYGYFRAWMDAGVSEAAMIRTIREMYQQKVSDTRDLFGGNDTSSFEYDPANPDKNWKEKSQIKDNYHDKMTELLGDDEGAPWQSDDISINWTSVARLKRFNGAYIVGGGRDECLKEVELLMNAFNIKYKRIKSLVYG